MTSNRIKKICTKYTSQIDWYFKTEVFFFITAIISTFILDLGDTVTVTVADGVFNTPPVWDDSVVRETENTDNICEKPSIGNDVDIFIPGVTEDEYPVVLLHDPSTLKLNNLLCIVVVYSHITSNNCI